MTLVRRKRMDAATIIWFLTIALVLIIHIRRTLPAMRATLATLPSARLNFADAR